MWKFYDSSGRAKVGQAGTKPFVVGTGASSLPNRAWPVANSAILVPFELNTTVTVATLYFNVWATGGNYDIGIYDEAGNLKVSKGSTANPSGVAPMVEVSVTPTTLAPGRYYLALAISQTTPFTTAADGSSSPLYHLSRQVASALPLPATITIGSTKPTGVFNTDGSVPVLGAVCT